MTADWRLGPRWSEDELWQALARASHQTRSFEEATSEEMTPDRGWNQVRSDAVIAQEEPGPVAKDGPFVRARHALAWFDFSDPRIVKPHFDARTPLRGRNVLLELQAMGLRFLSPVRVGQVVDEVKDGCTTFGFSLETLPGHIERGREWLVLTKDHRTGLVRFCIRAAWRGGDFPNAWSWFGFQLLARRYQRAWHHLAHARLRALANGKAALPASPVQFHAIRARALFDPSIEREEEALRNDRLLTGAALAALCGGRSMAPLAVVKTAEGSLAAPVFALFAAGELAADKLPFLGNRTDPLALSGRAATGAIAADALARRSGKKRAIVALLGAASAVVGAFATFQLRKQLGKRLPNPLPGLVEDALVWGASIALVHRAHAHRGRIALAAPPTGLEWTPSRPIGQASGSTP